MFAYEFMVNAFLASGVVALVAGPVGWFLVLRGQTFAGHALAHVGFAGAAAATLFGLPPLAGLTAATLAGGAAMGLLGARVSGRDVAIGIVLAFALGLGLLFLHFNQGYAGRATALLFGNILAVDRGLLAALAGMAVFALAALAVLMRPLLFASLQPELAEAKGVSLQVVGWLFLSIVGLTVAVAAQIVGVLLVFALLVAPPATAQRLTSSLGRGLALAGLLALAEAWIGIAAAYYSGWPASFCIAALAALAYLLSFAVQHPARGSITFDGTKLARLSR